MFGERTVLCIDDDVVGDPAVQVNGESIQDVRSQAPSLDQESEGCVRQIRLSSSSPCLNLFALATTFQKGASVNTAPTCTRADAHSSRAHITVHNLHIDPHFSNVCTPHWLKEKGICVAHFSALISISLSCPCQMVLLVASLLSRLHQPALCQEHTPINLPTRNMSFPQDDHRFRGPYFTSTLYFDIPEHRSMQSSYFVETRFTGESFRVCVKGEERSRPKRCANIKSQATSPQNP